MVHWVYVLESSETGSVYVGETIRLFRRWHEHSTGRGGVTTSRENYDTLIGLYNVPHNLAFSDFHHNRNIFSNPIGRIIRTWDYEPERYEALRIENHITERYAYEYKGNTDVRGGKYCLRRCCVKDINVDDRPLCKCGYPCEINMKKDKSKLFFTCPIPEWVDYGYNIPHKCNFWQEYKPYGELKAKSDIENRIQYAIEQREEGMSEFLAATNDEFLTK